MEHPHNLETEGLSEIVFEWECILATGINVHKKFSEDLTTPISPVGIVLGSYMEITDAPDR